MKTSRIVTFASLIAVAALVFGAAVWLPMNDAVHSPQVSAPADAASLEPIVVVATR